MEDYKPNSYRFKEEQKEKEREKKIEKVVKGKVITKKKSKIGSFAGQIISEDANSAGGYVMGEVIIPALKKTISDIVTNGIDIILYGESGGRNRRSTADRVSYSSYSDRDRRPSQVNRIGTGYSYDDIILDSRAEAMDVLSRMEEIIDTYKVVSVADLYDLVGVRGNYTDNKYGWTSMRNADVIRCRDGYQIKLPRAMPID